MEIRKNFYLCIDSVWIVDKPTIKISDNIDSDEAIELF